MSKQSPVEGFVHNGRTVFALLYRLECPPPQVVELVVPLDHDGNAIGPARPAEPGKRIVNVKPGDTIIHGTNERRVLSVEVYRSLPVAR